MEVRRAREDEYEAVGQLTLAAYEALGDGVIEATYAAELTDVASRAAAVEVLVAVDGGELLGAVAFVPGPGTTFSEFDDADGAGIRMLAVAPAAQGRGAGAALVDACLDRARAAGRRRVHLHTTEHMVTAHGIYERRGFVRDQAADWIPDEHYRLLAYVCDLTAAS